MKFLKILKFEKKKLKILKFYEIFENLEIFVNGIFLFSMMSNASIGNVTINIYGDNFKNP